MVTHSTLTWPYLRILSLSRLKICMPQQVSRRMCSMHGKNKIVKSRRLVRRRKAIAIISIGKYIAIKIEETLEENDSMNR